MKMEDDAIAALDSVDINKVLPDEKTISNVLEGVLKAALNSIEVEKEKEAYTAGNVSDKAKCFTVNISQESLLNMAMAVCEYLQETDDVKDYLVDLVKYAEDLSENIDAIDSLELPSEDEIISSYDLAIEDAIDSIEDSLDYASTEELITIKTYVDSSFNILAISIDVPEENTSVFLGKAVDGANVGYEVSCDSYGYNVLTISGNGKESGDKFTGEITVTVSGEEMATLNCEKLIVNEENIKGTVEVAINEDILDELSEELGDFVDLANFTIKLDMDNTFDNINTSVYIMSGENEFASLLLEQKTSGKGKVNIPEDTTDDAEEWSQNIDFSTIEENLKKTGLSEEILDVLDFDNLLSAAEYATSDVNENVDYYY